MASEGRTILGGSNTGGTYVDLQVWIGDPKDATKGITVENECIQSIDITENLFTTLPTINMVLTDSGRFFFRYNIRIGDTLNVRMGPAATTKDEEDQQPEPYIAASFSVQTVVDIPDNRNNTYIHRVVGVYNALGFINKIIEYPKGKSLLEPIPLKKSSAEAMQDVVQEAGLGFVADVATADHSFWLNADETAAQFCERILKHTWIADDDAPILYTDVAGTAHLTSVQTIAKNKTQTEFGDTQAHADGGDPKTPTIMIDDVFCLNAGGPITNQGGYKVQTSFYTPKNMAASQNMVEFPQHGQGMLGAAVKAVSSLFGGGTKDRSEAYREKEYQHNDPYLGGISNKQQSERDNVTIHADGGMHFDELHDHYEVAPPHNEMIRRSFFQNFVRLMVDTSKQGDLYQKVQYRPRLASAVKCDFSSSQRIDSIHSGEYAVAEIVHKYSKGEPYTQAITLVNDGYFDVGE
jgi:hypothetical protein